MVGFVHAELCICVCMCDIDVIFSLVQTIYVAEITFRQFCEVMAKANELDAISVCLYISSLISLSAQSHVLFWHFQPLWDMIRDMHTGNKRKAEEQETPKPKRQAREKETTPGTNISIGSISVRTYLHTTS